MPIRRPTLRAYLALVPLVLVPAAVPTPHPAAAAGCPPPAVVGHRGSPRNAPENTLASFTAALDEGADWLETDVRTTLDGVPVLLHDETLDRLTGTPGRVQDLDYERLSRLRIRTGPGPDQPIARLTDLLDRLRARPARLLLEIKEPSTPADTAAIAREAAASGVDVELYSFSADILRLAHDAAPGLPVTLIQAGWRADPPGTLPLHAVSLEHPLATPDRIAAEHAAHHRVYAWTPDDQPTWTRLATTCTDAIVTNTPAPARATLADLHQKYSTGRR